MNDYRFTDPELSACIERIVTLYTYDNITLLDCVLTDDPADPEYSANTVYSRLEDIRIFEERYFQRNYPTVESLLSANGYSQEDIALLHSKRDDENKRHPR